MTTQIVDLTADELMHLTDGVKNHDHGEQEQPLCVFPLILKLGGSYVELFTDLSSRPTSTIAVAFTEPELWLLRSKVTSYDKTQADALFGVKLLVKLYRALLACNAPELPSADVDGQSITAEQRQALKQIAGGDM